MPIGGSISPSGVGNAGAMQSASPRNAARVSPIGAVHACALRCNTEVVRVPAPVSYRLDPQLKSRLAQRAQREGISETSLVVRLLEEGLKTAEHPGMVYRGGPAGHRAAVAGGPDVWEVVIALRHTGQRGDVQISSAADQLGIPERLVRIAISFAATHPDEVEEMIGRNRDAAQEAERTAGERDRFLAS